MSRFFSRGVAAFGLALAAGASLFLFSGRTSSASSQAVVWFASGSNPASIQASVDGFRNALGNDNGTNAPAASGRRQINWDGVPDNFSAPNFMPGDFFNKNSPRGAVFTTPGIGFQNSADDDNPTNTAVRFGNLDPSYSHTFQTFSPQRIFTPVGSNEMDVHFFVPGTDTPATVAGFGAVFTDIDRTGSTTMEFFNRHGLSLGSVPVLAGPNGGLSFMGIVIPVDFDDARIARVRIVSGNRAAAHGALDGGRNDIVVMDDFIYGEPRAIQASAP